MKRIFGGTVLSFSIVSDEKNIMLASTLNAFRRQSFNWGTGALFLLILSLGITLRSWLAMEPIDSDPISYFIAGIGHDLWPKMAPAHHHQYLRPVMAWLVHLPGLVWGFSLKTYNVAVFLGYLLTFISMLTMSVAFSNIRAALIVTLLWATSYIFLSVDSTLTPDNVGTALALLGISAIVLAARMEDATPKLVKFDQSAALTLVGGFLLWAACAARETFVIFIVVAAVVVLTHHSKGRRLVFVTCGLLLGTAIELGYFQFHYGDPFFRIKYFLNIGEIVEKSQGHMAIGSLGPMWLVTRFPKLIWYTGSAEYLLFFLGGLGGLLWLTKYNKLDNRVKLTLLFLPLGFIAFALRSFSPIGPYFETNLRYMATCVPIFYLASADIMLAMLDGFKGKSGVGRFLPVALIGIFLSAVMIWNVTVASSNLPYAKKNGFNAYTVSADAISKDVKISGWPKRIFSQHQEDPMGALFFPSSQGWEREKATRDFPKNGYFVLSWPRINSDGNAFEYFDLFEHYPLIFRHRVGPHVTDVYRVGPEKRQRQQVRVTPEWSSQWTVVSVGSHGGNSLSGTTETTLTVPPNQGYIYSGKGAIQAPPANAIPLPGNQWVKLSFRAKTTVGLAVVRADLHGWQQGAGVLEPVTIYLGQIYMERMRSIEGHAIMKNYLPRDLVAFRLEIHARGGNIQVKDLQLDLLAPYPEESNVTVEFP